MAAVQSGLEKLPKLRVLFVSNNKVKDWAEVDRLTALPSLEELLLVGNPLHTDFKDRGALPEFRQEVRVHDIDPSSCMFHTSSRRACLRGCKTQEARPRNACAKFLAAPCRCSGDCQD